MKTETIYNKGEQTVNLNSSPITIPNLDLINWDYHYGMVVLNSVSTSSFTVAFFPNADETANYRDYVMKGRTSVASGSVNDTASTGYVIGGMSKTTSTRTSLCIGTITGDDSVEKPNRNSLCLQDGTATAVIEADDYMKDTSSNVTSLLLKSTLSTNITFNLRIWRTPKLSNNELWEKMDIKTFTASGATQTFSNLDGDRDRQYKVNWDSSTTSGNITVRQNADATADKTKQQMQNSGGTLSSNNSTSQTGFVLDGSKSEIIIDAITGKERLGVSESSEAGAVIQQVRNAHWDANTATNITSFAIIPSISLTGVATLWRKRKFELADILPWETIAEHDIANVDFSGGFDFTGLKGNDYFFIRLLYVGDDVTGGDQRLRFNNDATSIYDRQFLRSQTTTATAGFSNSTEIQGFGDARKVNNAIFIIYPKDGFQRPCLQQSSSNEDRLLFGGYWYGDTSTEITSILAFAANTGPTKGKLTLQVIR